MARKVKTKFEEETPQRAKLDENGHEIVDSRPHHSALNIRRTPTIQEQIRNAVRSESLAREALAAGMETFEEADDFEIGDDYDPESPYENEFEPEVPQTPAADSLNPRNAPPKAETPPGTPPAGEPLEPTPPQSGGSAKR